MLRISVNVFSRGKKSDAYIEETVIIVRFLELKLSFLLPKVSIPLNTKIVAEMYHTACTDISTCGHRNSFAFHVLDPIWTQKRGWQECTTAEVPWVDSNES